MRILLLSLMMLSITPSALPSQWVEKGKPSPYSGLLLPRERAIEMAAILETHPSLIRELTECQVELARARRRPFWRRPSFWIPATAIAFAGGLWIGLGS